MPPPFNASSACLNAASDVIWLFANRTNKRANKLNQHAFLVFEHHALKSCPQGLDIRLGWSFSVPLLLGSSWEHGVLTPRKHVDSIHLFVCLFVCSFDWQRARWHHLLYRDMQNLHWMVGAYMYNIMKQSEWLVSLRKLFDIYALARV